jgi:hypothetical protein
MEPKGRGVLDHPLSRMMTAGGCAVTRVGDWPYSSFHRMLKIGIYPEDWAGDVSNNGGDFGERP